MQLNSSGPI